MTNRRRLLPHTSTGISAVLAGVLALSLWIILPMVTMSYRETYPITDSWIMPAASSVVSLIAGLVNVYVVVVHKERSWLNLGITIVLSGIALIALTVMLGGMLFEPSA